MDKTRSMARRALACLDLTNLDEGCTPADVAALCARAQTPHGPVAAVCLWPRHVARAKEALEGTGIRVATVVNFPTGDRPPDYVTSLTQDALEAGADEIDMVIPWRELLAGRGEPVARAVRLVRRVCGPVTLKAILETGKLGRPDLIRAASDLALAEGADFLKTSTGKVPVNATPEAAEIMLHAIRDSGRRAGLKPSGGIRTTADAARYLALADRIMGESWATPATFRIGASSLIDALLATLDGVEAPGTGAGY